MTALTEIRDKVAEGGTPTRAEWAVVFPDTPEDDDYPRSEMARGACGGWVSAALALMGEVLPGWGWRLQDMNIGTGAVAVTVRDDTVFEVRAATPSRALLLAILDALIAKEKET